MPAQRAASQIVPPQLSDGSPNVGEHSQDQPSAAVMPPARASRLASRDAGKALLFTPFGRKPGNLTSERYDMSKAVSLALLAGGIVLIVLGVMAAESLSSDISRFFTGAPTDKAIWMLIGGVVASIVGVVGLLRG